MIDTTEVNKRTLLNRSRGDKYFVDTTGLLLKMNWGQRVVYSLSRNCSKLFGDSASKVAQAVKSVISDLIQQPDTFTDQELKDFYLEKTGSLSRLIYDRVIPKSLETKLIKLIPNPSGTKTETFSDQYKTAYKAAKVWARMGNYEMCGGTSGTYKIYGTTVAEDGSQTTTNFGVFKISEEEQLASNNPRLMQKIKRIFYSLIFHLSGGFLCKTFKIAAGQGFLAEVAARTTERFLIKVAQDNGLPTPSEYVPDTHVAKIGMGASPERIGSFQLWIDGALPPVNLCDFLGTCPFFIPNGTVPEEALQQEHLRRLALFDFITGNIDRHGENALVVKNADGSQGHDMYFIDGGSAMAPEHPNGWNLLILRNKYRWRDLLGNHKDFPADLKFSPEEQSFIEKLYDKKEELVGQIRELYNHHLKDESVENEERVQRMLERIEVLHFMRNQPIAELAKVRTQKDFNRLLPQIPAISKTASPTETDSASEGCSPLSAQTVQREEAVA